jgi:mannose-6-phosphate isomerase-like protein (cupin superfamily)
VETRSQATARSLVEEESAIGVREKAPHDAGGETTAFRFFSNAPDFKMAFRKRILHKGSAIGYHLQDFDEVYYILSGTGEYTLNGVKRQVGPGTAMLTRPCDSHGLRPTGDGELALIIAYQTPSP